MSRYKAYPEYAPSETDLADELPVGWRTLRGKYVFSEYSERSEFGEEQLLSVSEYYGVKPRGEVIDEGDFLSRAESLAGYKKCQKNDLVMNIMLAWKCGLGVSKYDGIVSPAYSVFRFNGNASPDYMHYLLRTETYTSHFKTRSTGVIDSRLRLYPESFGDVSIILPSSSEQVRIVAFLDHETAKIDALIEKQRRLIELLKEKRQAVISHAVTKGLNPKAPMKDSGVEWLGEVPAHWGVQRVKFVSSFTTSGPRGWSELVGEDGALFIQSGDLNDALAVDFADAKRVQVGNNAETQRTLLCHGDVVVCITGAKTGNVAVCSVVPEASYINQHLCLIRPTSEIHPMFLAVLLKSTVGQTYFELSQYGLKQGLSLEDVREAPVFVPPSAEQAAITTYLAAETEKLDLLSAQALLSKDLLHERRTALISAAVTGKIDVRDWQAAA